MPPHFMCWPPLWCFLCPALFPLLFWLAAATEKKVVNGKASDIGWWILFVLVAILTIYSFGIAVIFLIPR